MHYVAGMVGGWFSLHERLIFQSVLKNISLQLEEELEHEVRDSLESLSIESDTANHNTWNDFANLEDEELGRLGLSCHYALEWLCAEPHTF